MNKKIHTSGNPSRNYSRIPHGVAVLLTISAFPLIWVGGLVTTYGAGMAVPDWPNTYGWNMFLYPPSTWLYGGFDLMVEHGHRLLASLSGLISIALWLAALKYDSRRWFKWWCFVVLLAVVVQGSLGGARVLLDERAAAMIHACLAQLFLAMVTATAVMSSRWWITGVARPRHDLEATSPKSRLQPAGRWLAWISAVLLTVAYCQVVAGAQLRHIPASASPERFMGLVHLHLFLAGIVFLISGIAAMVALSTKHLSGGVKWPVCFILAVVVIQIALGGGTWLVNYALPWQEFTDDLARFTITAKGYWESVIVTSHVATGALLVCLATMACVRAWRSRALWHEAFDETGLNTT